MRLGSPFKFLFAKMARQVEYLDNADILRNMSSVYFKTIVSSIHEYPYVRMNIEELLQHVDFFLVTEANVTHTGDEREYEFLDRYQTELEGISKKIKCVRMNLRDDCTFSITDPDILHSNEQKIRDGFRKSIELRKNDIVISCDADEVLFRRRVKSLLARIRSSPLAKNSYRLRLHQVIYRLDYLWKDCNFQGPIICRAGYFMAQEKPQWRYEGSRTYLKSGTHFSWVMPVDDMVKKISRYSHRVENSKFASRAILRNAVEEKKYIFEPDRKFSIAVNYNFKEKCYPSSLEKYMPLFPKEVKP
jgi:beta-1,4-mannosyl-glycoprotein beta-1,4-N-acetylglucosaminyltransferase